jgi:hypothetical protein
VFHPVGGMFPQAARGDIDVRGQRPRTDGPPARFPEV